MEDRALELAGAETRAAALIAVVKVTSELAAEDALLLLLALPQLLPSVDAVEMPLVLNSTDAATGAVALSELLAEALADLLARALAL